MKLNSVLVRRAWILAAIVVLVAIAVQLPVTALLKDRFAERDTRVIAAERIQTLIDSANIPGAYSGVASVLDGLDSIVWLCDATGMRVVTSQNASLPMKTAAKVAELGEGERLTTVLHVGKQKYILTAQAAFSNEGIVTATFALATPYYYGSAGAAQGIALALAALCCAGAAALGVVFLILPIAKPLREINEVANEVAGGGMTALAPEDGPGEIGDLGRAINNVSSQLSRSLYTLIVERNRLKSVLDGLSEGIVAVNAKGAITHANPAMNRMFHPSGDAKLYLPNERDQLVPDPKVWEDFDFVVAGAEPITRDFVVRDMNVRMTITPIRDELDNTAGAVGLFSDITQMERLERTRREYVSNVSHELRTPLTAVRALVEPLRDGMVTNEADRQRYYDIILREVMRLSRLINDQLELSRLQSGNCAIEKTAMKVEQLIMETCDNYVSIAEEKGLTLSVPTDFAEFPEVTTNADRLEEILIILLDNAIKYTEKGGVTVSGAFDDEVVRIRVADTGVGISEVDLPYVFDRFYKVDKAHSGKGSGLGLSIAKELMALMGETIEVTSEKGKGTAFTFTVHRSGKAEEQA